MYAVPSDLLLVGDHLAAVAHKGGVKVEDDVDEKDDVHNGVDDNHDHRIIVDGPINIGSIVSDVTNTL
jgi:hypothetical protein